MRACRSAGSRTGARAAPAASRVGTHPGAAAGSRVAVRHRAVEGEARSPLPASLIALGQARERLGIRDRGSFSIGSGRNGKREPASPYGGGDPAPHRAATGHPPPQDAFHVPRNMCAHGRLPPRGTGADPPASALPSGARRRLDGIAAQGSRPQPESRRPSIEAVVRFLYSRSIHAESSSPRVPAVGSSGSREAPTPPIEGRHPPPDGRGTWHDRL